ncbi:hypothetical protein F2P56_037044 [Juglans regia]|uniref:Uncharacterized protein LOC109018055 n=2 Tax=Juglans regia TaxID=51240 RepID=A0A2I4HHZ8_JUGRE|nr:uncharacterized protein LOC109018055 [Juglans regia]KAF5442080.1 hypothetical protein F2P56_037044 [Juglans regia]
MCADVVGDRVYLKVWPMKGVVHFGERGKLSPRYVGPYEMIEWTRRVAYRLDLLAEMQGIHGLFHVSSLKKRFKERRLVIMEPSSIKFQSNLSYEEWPVQIVDRKEQELRIRKIPLVKVPWNNMNFQEATWKREDSLKTKYLHLFVS